MARGQNIFDDLISDAQEVITSVLVGAGEPLDALRLGMLHTSIDRLLETINKVATAGPSLGEQFDIDQPPPNRSERPATMPVVVTVNEDTLEDLEERGYFDQFNPHARERVRTALEGLDSAKLQVQSFKGYPGTVLGLVDLVATTIQVAVTGNDSTLWKEG